MEELVKKDWVLNKDTGLIFIAHSLMMLPPHFTSYMPTVEEIVAGCKLSPAIPVPALDMGDEGSRESVIIIDPVDPVVDLTPDRTACIKAAVLAVPVESYGAAGFGRPSMPKVADIKAATGYADVTAEEIVAALVVVAPEGE